MDPFDIHIRRRDDLYPVINITIEKEPRNVKVMDLK